MNEKINLVKLFQMLRRRLLSILLTTLLFFAMTGCAVYYFAGPYYQYTKQILVGNLNGDDSSSNLQLISSYVDLVKSPSVLEIVKNDLKLKRSIYSLSDQISIENNQNSLIVTIVVKDKDPKLVKKIATNLVQCSLDKMNGFIGNQNMQVVDNEDIGEPKLYLTTLILSLLMSIIIGIFFGVCVAILREQFDDSIRKFNEIEEILGIPVMGCIEWRQWR